MRIIALTGPKGCGKSTVIADHLVNRYGFTRVRFAGPLKAMLRTLGLSEEQIEGSLKETPSKLLCGKTPRFAMQQLGTEWRDLIGRDLWLNATIADMVAMNADGIRRFVVDDLRFSFEAEGLLDLGADIWRVRRPAVEEPITEATHASEREWRTLPARVELFNDNTLDAARGLVDTIMEGRLP